MVRLSNGMLITAVKFKYDSNCMLGRIDTPFFLIGTWFSSIKQFFFGAFSLCHRIKMFDDYVYFFVQKLFKYLVFLCLVLLV